MDLAAAEGFSQGFRLGTSSTGSDLGVAVEPHFGFVVVGSGVVVFLLCCFVVLLLLMLLFCCLLFFVVVLTH